MYRVYVIQNEEGRFYIGLTDDVIRRVNDHNAGVSTWTHYRGPWQLRWTSEAMSLGEARKLENFLKKQKGGNGFFAHTGLTRSGS
jgi:putative endonuclease